MFHELYFSMYYLAQTLLPGHNVTSDDFLFRHLTRVLDRRMLALMMQRELFPMLRTAALNLNVRTVLAAEFMEFDKATNIKDRGSLAIELPALDIMNDPNEYLFARDFLKERGYKIVLDGVKHLNLPLIDRDWLGFDFVKVTWTPSLLDDAATQRGEALKAACQQDRPRTRGAVPRRQRRRPEGRRSARHHAVPGPAGRCADRGAAAHHSLRRRGGVRHSSALSLKPSWSTWHDHPRVA